MVAESGAARPSVSIIINNYNYGRYLAAAIDSALAQTYPGVEVIVVDDGSTDGSREIIAGYGGRVTPVLKANGGQASALNEGFAASRGEIVLFLDADDTLRPEAVEAVVAIWRPGIAKAQFFLDIIDADGRPLGTRFPPDGEWRGRARDLILSVGSYPSTGTTGNAFARDVLARLFPVPEERWRRQPDSYLILLSPFFGDVVRIDRTLGSYRSHGANQWTTEVLNLDRIREHLTGDELRESALREWAPTLGITVPADWMLRTPMHVQSRLASLRLAPERHPYRGDRRWRLALRGVRASWRAPMFSHRKRFFFSLWFLLTAALPRRLARPLVALGFSRRRRPSLLQALVS